MNPSIPRPEYPRPDFQRSEWLNLNGKWQFEFDDADIGRAQDWQNNKEFSTGITVPYCYQCKLSGVQDPGMHEIMWYKRQFQLPGEFKSKRIIINFGAVDYYAKVWINGKLAGVHQGGYVPFKFDITRLLTDHENVITVRVEDRYDTVQPRGKQYWKAKPDRCWYTPISGIWQTVWLETTGDVMIDRIRLTPNIDKSVVEGEIYFDRLLSDLAMVVSVKYQGEFVNQFRFCVNERIAKFTLNIKEPDDIDEIHYWTPETPNLYDIELTLSKGSKIIDNVRSYFGMREIAIHEGHILLNNRPLYQKLVLDQGYWPESLLTPPSDEAIRYDIEMTKQMGFNGARKHQKMEDPRYYYWADKLGLLVWGEMPSAYQFNSEEIVNLTKEWLDFINRDYNHPSIITWVPFNESWGVRNIFTDQKQQDFAVSLYYIARAMDGSRLISANDGWEQVQSDLCAIHDYVASGNDFNANYADKKTMLDIPGIPRLRYAKGTSYQGEPVIISEYGGIAFESDHQDNWGYFGAVKNEAEFLKRYAGITGAIRETQYICGYCYTQLTDVMQEINGLLTADRQLKVSLEGIQKING